jgi:hypothetical protein
MAKYMRRKNMFTSYKANRRLLSTERRQKKEKKGQWSTHEDRLLIEWIKKNGPTRWNLCANYIRGRNAKQCREHWTNCLNPNLIKGYWSVEEDLLIMHFYEKCDGSWKRIIPLFQNRTENAIKNRFFSQLRKIATQNLNSSNKKNIAKIKLKDLQKYLTNGVLEAKNEFLKKYSMDQEKLIQFLEQAEEKIRNVKLSDNESIDTKTSSNYSLLENYDNIKNENTKKVFKTEVIEDKLVHFDDINISHDNRNMEDINEEKLYTFSETKCTLVNYIPNLQDTYNIIYSDYYNYQNNIPSKMNEEINHNDLFIDNKYIIP